VHASILPLISDAFELNACAGENTKAHQRG